MAHSLTLLLVHVVFSTKRRERLIDGELKPRLHAYLGGIVHEEGATAHIINGFEDHVHILIGLPAARAHADRVRIVKTNSSRWVHELEHRYAGFAWQSGYGAFSVSRSKFDEVSAYIARQAEHDQTQTFEEEYLAMLMRHGIEAVPRLALWAGILRRCRGWGGGAGGSNPGGCGDRGVAAAGGRVFR